MKNSFGPPSLTIDVKGWQDSYEEMSQITNAPPQGKSKQSQVTFLPVFCGPKTGEAIWMTSQSEAEVQHLSSAKTTQHHSLFH